MGRYGLALGAGVAGIALGALAMHYQGGGDKGRIEAIVHDYVLANPEIIPQAIENLQQREAASRVAENRAALEMPWPGAWAGAEDGDVVLVEFFDYACGFCRASNPDVARLLAEDPRLKVVWRELPVLGPDSEVAARASLAAARAGRFKDFHTRLFAEGRPSAAAVTAAATAIGLPPPPSDDSQDGQAALAELQKNIGLARAIGASGTPTFVIGDEVLSGAVGYDRLKQAIADARAG